MQKVCVLTSQRTGSSWLMQLFYDHQEIEAYHEVFINVSIVGNPSIDPEREPPCRYIDYRDAKYTIRPFKTLKYLSMLERTAQENGKKALVFKIMYNQLFTYPELVLWLVLKRYKIIHLVRENYLDSAISAQISNRTKVVHTYKDQKDLSRYTLDVDVLIDYVKRRDNHVRFIARLLSILPVKNIKVSYDDLVADTQKIMNKLYEYACVSPHTLSNEKKFQKIIQVDRATLIENYEQVALAFKKAGFKSLL